MSIGCLELVSAWGVVKRPNVQLEGLPGDEAHGEPASIACRRSPRSAGWASASNYALVAGTLLFSEAQCSHEQVGS